MSLSMRLSVLPLAALVVVSAVIFLSVPSAHAWGYGSNELGPNQWPLLFPTCAATPNQPQSPIPLYVTPQSVLTASIHAIDSFALSPIAGPTTFQGTIGVQTGFAAVDIVSMSNSSRLVWSTQQPAVSPQSSTSILRQILLHSDPEHFSITDTYGTPIQGLPPFAGELHLVWEDIVTGNLSVIVQVLTPPSTLTSSGGGSTSTSSAASSLSATTYAVGTSFQAIALNAMLPIVSEVMSSPYVEPALVYWEAAPAIASATAAFPLSPQGSPMEVLPLTPTSVQVAYQGSLTAPPCTQAHYVVSTTPLQLTAQGMSYLSQLKTISNADGTLSPAGATYATGARPLQPHFPSQVISTRFSQPAAYTTPLVALGPEQVRVTNSVNENLRAALIALIVTMTVQAGLIGILLLARYELIEWPMWLGGVALHVETWTNPLSSAIRDDSDSDEGGKEGAEEEEEDGDQHPLRAAGGARHSSRVAHSDDEGEDEEEREE